MSNSTSPFRIGERVVCVDDFNDVRAVWGFNYPHKDDIVMVTSIRKHPKYDFWLITIDTCEVEMCHRNFRRLSDTRHSEAVVTATELLKIEEEKGVDIVPQVVEKEIKASAGELGS